MERHWKTILVCCIGSILEWYDFALFGLMAPVFTRIFFHAENEKSLLLVFATFASGFLMRPLGAIFFGSKGDKQGRKSALSSTIIWMAISTTLIGCAPTYHQLGILAPIWLVVLRLLQGFSASGEYPNAITLMSEVSPPTKRGFFASFSVMGVVGGILLGSLSITLTNYFITHAEFEAWGWRIPFIASIPLGCLGYYLRYKLPESSFFEQLARNNNLSPSPIMHAISLNKRAFFETFSIYLLATVAFYTVFIYFSGYLAHVKEISLEKLSLINSINMGIMIFFVPIFGYLSDIFSRKAILLIGALCILIFTYPLAMIYQLFFYHKCFSRYYLRFSQAPCP